jgi:phage-related minor tail protein
MNDSEEFWSVTVEADTRGLEQSLASATRLGRQFSNALAGALSGAADKGRDLSDVLKGLALSLSRMALQAALRPLEGAFSSAFASLIAGGVPFARGGVLQHNTPVPFAAGGVIRSPISFPLAGGRLGIAGERGPEAILPLARGPDGSLGVRAAATGGSQIVMHVTTPDAESFRRSETQIGAMLVRMGALGQRNL